MNIKLVAAALALPVLLAACAPEVESTVYLADVMKAVESGEVSLNMAEKIVKLNPAAQKRIVNAPPQSRPHELRAALNRQDACQRRGNNRGDPKLTLPAEPSTPFVRKLLSGLERLAMSYTAENSSF